MATKNEEQLDIEEVVAGGQVHTEGHGATDFFQKYKNIIFALGGLLVVGIGYFVWTSMGDSKNEDANDAAYQATFYWEKDSLNKALNGDGVAMGLNSIVDDYGSTAVGNQAKFMKGIAELKQGKVEEGAASLKSFSKGDNLVSASAELALGFAAEEQNKEEEAAEHFEKAASYTSDKDDQLRPVFLQLAGEAFEAAGKKDKALEIYKNIKAKYPMSQEGQKIEKYIGRAEQ